MASGAIRKGLRLQYEEEGRDVQEQTILDPNRKKEKFEKNLDNLLFGPGPKKPTKDPKKQQEKKKQQELRKKQQEERKKKQKQQLARSQELQRKRKEQQERRKEEEEERLRQEEIQKRKVPEQPEQYVVVDMGQPYRMDLDVKHVYNRPIYIRKYKKIAQDFDYYTQNERKNHATDVIRPIECVRKQVLKNRAPNFIDTSFPPNQRALGPALRGMVSSWNKASQIAKKPVLGKYIDPNDIKAGRFSSPQFLSTLSCLAQRQNNIKRIIQKQVINEDGFYYVRIFLNGVWRYVMVDDSIPILGGQPACATSYLDEQTDLWVALVEKAYAKIFLQGYHLFATVQSHELYLRDLTGAPSHVYPMNNPDILKIISNALQKGWGLIAVGNEQSLNVGLNPNFSFNILKCDGKGLELRNSWGSIEQKSTLNTTKQGTFQMNYEQCKKFLNHVIIAKTNDNYFSTVIEGNHRKGFCGSYTFKIRRETKGFLTLSQTDERLIPGHVGYKYSSSKMILEKKTPQGGSFVNAITGENWRNIDLEVILSPGEYIVHTIIDYKAEEYDYFLSWYGEQQIQFKKAYNRYYPQIVYQSLQQVCHNEGKQISARGGIGQYVLHHQSSNLILYTIENTTDKQVNTSVDFSKVDFSNLVLLNCKNKGDNLCDKSKHELEQYRQNCYKDKKWLVYLGPHESYTWVFSSTVAFNKGNMDRWGFK